MTRRSLQLSGVFLKTKSLCHLVLLRRAHLIRCQTNSHALRRKSQGYLSLALLVVMFRGILMPLRLVLVLLLVHLVGHGVLGRVQARRHAHVAVFRDSVRRGSVSMIDYDKHGMRLRCAIARRTDDLFASFEALALACWPLELPSLRPCLCDVVNRLIVQF